MCYAKPGPRCSSHAKIILDKAISSGSPTDVLDAMDNYDETPAGHRELANVVRNATTARFRMNAQSRLSSAKQRRTMKLARFAALNNYNAMSDNVTGEGSPLFHQQDDTDEELLGAVNAAVAQGSMSYFEPGEYRTFNAPRSSATSLEPEVLNDDDNLDTWDAAKQEVKERDRLLSDEEIKRQRLQRNYERVVSQSAPYFEDEELKQYAIQANNPRAAYGTHMYDSLKSDLKAELEKLNQLEKRDKNFRDAAIKDVISNNGLHKIKDADGSMKFKSLHDKAEFNYEDNYTLLEQMMKEIDSE